MNFTANGITQYDLTRQAKCKCYFVTTPKLKRETLMSIIRQAGIPKEAFENRK